MRHVGDGDDEAPTLGSGGTVDGVIEISGVLAVDGHERKRTQIPSGRLVSFLDLSSKASGFRHDVVRPLLRQRVAADGDVDLDARRHVFAEHLLHPPDRRRVCRRRLFDRSHHHLPGARPRLRARRHLNVLRKPGVIGAHECDAAFAPEASHDLAAAAFEHFDHRPLHPRVTVAHEWPHQRAVSVHEASHLPRSKIDALAALVRRQEPVTVRMSVHAPPHEVQLLNEGVPLLPVAHHLPIALHGEEAARQGPHLVRLREAGCSRDGIQIHRRPLVGEDAHQGFPIRNPLRMAMLAPRACESASFHSAFFLSRVGRWRLVDTPCPYDRVRRLPAPATLRGIPPGPRWRNW